MGETDGLVEGETGLHTRLQHIQVSEAAVTQETSCQSDLAASHLTGVGVGPFTCLTGEGDCCRPAVTLVTKEGGDFEVGFGGMRGGVL